jgi:class 3 adenylate cyclase
MRGRSKAASVKSRRRKPAAPKRVSGTEAARLRSSSAAESDVARLNRELGEARQEQTATADVLRIISSSGSLERVFETILANAMRLCDADTGHVLRAEASALSVAAMRGGRPEYAQFWRERGPWRPAPDSAPAQVIEQRKPVQIADMSQTSSYAAGGQATVAAVELGGLRTVLMVPMIADEKAIGIIVIYRGVVRPFSDKQIALVQSFAAQAVIAIENARLLNELRQRTADLGEALEQQTATSEVLKVISSSPGELELVFQAMLQNATKLCEAKFGGLFLYEAPGFRCVAHEGASAEHTGRWQREPFLDLRDAHPVLPLARVAATKSIVHDLDIAAQVGPDEIHHTRVFGLIGSAGARTVLGVPMLKEDALVGAIIIYRTEVRAFSDKQIALVQNFAAQAVIAIENARLLSELRQRTEEVVKLNQQLEQRVADQVGEIERMSRLRRFLPPQVADLIVASGTEKQLESHRREITALFCDLRGFTGFSESSDPEDVMALLAEYHAAIGTIINKYSGTLERYAGDGVMVIFNDPVPVENPALQAVLMALDMRAAIGELIEKWRELGHDLGFGIGIAHGFATLGTIGFEGRRDYAAIGTVSNVASRLCDEAKPGQILISPRVRQAIEKAVTVESIGEFNLKGIRRPMAAYNVLGTAEEAKKL